MNYSIDILIDDLKYEFSDTYISFKEYEFVYDDCIVTVTGTIQEDWVYDRGDYYTPPSADFVSRFAEIDEVVISYNDEREVKLSPKELYYMEVELRKK